MKFSWIASALLAFTLITRGQQELEVVGTADASKQIPISLSGYSGEVDSALRFDLEISGFKIVPTAAAKFDLHNDNSAAVEGRLSEHATKAVLFANAYNGGSKRTQAHALADDVVKAILHIQGIARTKIAFKVDTG